MSKTIASQLKSACLKKIKIPGDGNCQFHAIAYMIRHNNIPTRNHTVNHKELRKLARKLLKKNKSHYKNFIWDETFDDYLNNLKHGEYGDNLTLQVLSSADYGVPQIRERVFFIGIRNDIAFNKNKLIPNIDYSKKQYLKLWDAISDLPQIRAGKGEEEQEYFCKPKNKYQSLMRKNSKKIFNHVAMKHTDRLIERFKQIKYGVSHKLPYWKT